MNQERKNRIRRALVWLKFALLLCIVVLLPLFIYLRYHTLIENFRDPEALRLFLTKYKTESIFIYLGLQVLQLVICILPGQALQFAAGYAFHFPLGLFLTALGAALGTIVTFYIARLLGKDAMYLIFGEKKLEEYIEKLNSKRAYLLIFVIYLIPGIPKDIFAYAIGVSNMRFGPFFILSMLGRLPAMAGSIAIGVMVETGSYTGALLLLGAAVVLCGIGILRRKQLQEWTDKIYVRLRGL